MIQTVHEYWAKHTRDSLGQSLLVEPQPRSDSLVDSWDNRGIITARAWFIHDMYLDIVEEVTIHPNRVSRNAYAYHFQIDEGDWKRWHYDPHYEPEIRFHIDLPNETHIPDEWRTLKQVVEECWQMHLAHLDESGLLDD